MYDKKYEITGLGPEWLRDPFFLWARLKSDTLGQAQDTRVFAEFDILLL